MNLLIVDDNPDVAAVTARYLNLEGYCTQTTQSGRAAIDLVATGHVDGAIVDIGLPDLDGYEVARRLRESGYTGLLVALSGRGDPEDLNRSREAGFDDHVVKAGDPEVLLRRIATLANADPNKPRRSF